MRKCHGYCMGATSGEIEALYKQAFDILHERGRIVLDEYRLGCSFIMSTPKIEGKSIQTVGALEKYEINKATTVLLLAYTAIDCDNSRDGYEPDPDSELFDPLVEKVIETLGMKRVKNMQSEFPDWKILIKTLEHTINE